MIVVDHLTKRYAERTVVQDVSFKVEKGEILGFLGPNGAGKSTTMRMLTGYLLPSDGSVSIGGIDMLADPIKAKALIGYLPETPPLYPEMSVRDYLAYAAQLRGVPRKELKAAIDRAIERCWLHEVPKKLIAHLSKGFQQRVGIAQALIHNPPVLVLDEPTNGLDPNQIIQIRSLIKELAGDHTVILSTHILPEVQNTCERVLIINRGTVVAEGAPDELEARLRGGLQIRIEARAPEADLAAKLGGIEGVRTLKVEPKADDAALVVATVETAGVDLRERVASEVIGAGWGLLELKALSLSLEEIFLKLTTTEAATAASEQKEVVTHG